MVHRPFCAHAADTRRSDFASSVNNGESLFDTSLPRILQQGEEQRSSFLTWSSESSGSIASTSQANLPKTRSPSLINTRVEKQRGEPAITKALYSFLSWMTSSDRPGKGYSQMDWMRLVKQSPNLNGLGGQPPRSDITMEEVRQHRTKEDAWMVFNGSVYNISPYLQFHPGGVEILMRAAGKDGTALFLKHHPYVNMRALMHTCLVGKLVVDPLQAQAAADVMQAKLVRQQSQELAGSWGQQGAADCIAVPREPQPTQQLDVVVERSEGEAEPARVLVAGGHPAGPGQAGLGQAGLGQAGPGQAGPGQAGLGQAGLGQKQLGSGFASGQSSGTAEASS